MNAYDEIKIDYGIDELIDIHDFHDEMKPEESETDKAEIKNETQKTKTQTFDQ